MDSRYKELACGKVALASFRLIIAPIFVSIFLSAYRNRLPAPTPHERVINPPIQNQSQVIAASDTPPMQKTQNQRQVIAPIANPATVSGFFMPQKMGYQNTTR